MKAITILTVTVFAFGLGIAETHWKPLSALLIIGLGLYSFKFRRPKSYDGLNTLVNWLMLLLILLIAAVILGYGYKIYIKGGLI